MVSVGNQTQTKVGKVEPDDWPCTSKVMFSYLAHAFALKTDPNPQLNKKIGQIELDDWPCISKVMLSYLAHGFVLKTHPSPELKNKSVKLNWMIGPVHQK